MATLDTAQEALVYWMVLVEQAYVGVHETARVPTGEVPLAVQVLVTPPAVAVPV